MSRAIRTFKTDRIPVFERGDEEYERSVATPNLLYRFARPEFARAQKLVLTIKCGGHSYAGHSTAFEGVSLDLCRMNKTKLDMAAKTITFGAGCQWGHVYKTLINGRHNGFVINGGRCPFVEVGGFLLGGGLGPFSRDIGMGSDTVKNITIVTADAKLLTVKDTDSRSSNEGRLFWARRGAGGGNFGVVVEIGQAAASAGRKNEPDLFNQENFMSTMNTFYTTDWPERITVDSTWICDLRVSSGNVHQAPGAKKLKRHSLPENSTRFLHETLVAQWSEETAKAFPTNKSYSIYSSFVFRNNRSTIERVAAFRKAFPGERVEFLATFIHSGGKMSTPKPVDSAFFWREATYRMYLTLEWEDKWMKQDMRAFLGEAKRELRPLSLQGEAAFINFPDAGVLGRQREELRRVKEIWDKDNFFQSEQGVRLPGGLKGGPEKSGDQGNDEDLTDSLATKQWEVYETKDIVGDLQELADLGL
ncbi:hypothetical protein B0H14DRAFT_3501994 [Mycena olivaceomarginata]|nr:hypothetical protein B0H14DRAFT_3501994 [Mycena olivaceomarginata]